MTLTPAMGSSAVQTPGHNRRDCLRCAAAVLLAGNFPAAAVDKPAGAVVLTLRGRLRNPNQGELAQLDMAQIEAMPQTSFNTRTPWFPQARLFTGPLLREVLGSVGAHGSMLRLSSLNDYRVEMPFDDALRFNVVVARLLDGKPMAVRDKGPLFVIYPFDARPELRSALYYSRAAWQLRTIDVL